MYHHCGLSGCLCVWLLVLTIGVHGGGCIASMLSLMRLASCSMKVCAGTLYGVGMVCFWLRFCVLFIGGSYK